MNSKAQFNQQDFLDFASAYANQRRREISVWEVTPPTCPSAARTETQSVDDEVQCLTPSTTEPEPPVTVINYRTIKRPRFDSEGPSSTATRYTGAAAQTTAIGREEERPVRYPSPCAATLAQLPATTQTRPPLATKLPPTTMPPTVTIRPTRLTLTEASITPDDRFVLLNREEQAHLRTFHQQRLAAALRQQALRQQSPRSPSPDPVSIREPSMTLGAGRLLPWNDKPLFSPMQLQAFTQHDWEARIFRPFVALMSKKRLGVALRFLAYVSAVPHGIHIPQYVKQCCTEYGIGNNMLDVAMLFLHDLPYIQRTATPFLHNVPLIFNHQQVAVKVEQRTFHVQQQMKDFP